MITIKIAFVLVAAIFIAPSSAQMPGGLVIKSVPCPNQDNLGSIILGNYLRTPVEAFKMEEEEERNIVITEVEKITGHTTADLQGRANKGDFGSLTGIANMAYLLIKYSIKCRSDVKTMTYSNLRNTLISKYNKLYSKPVSELQKKTDHQLVKAFCKGLKKTTTTTPTITCPGSDNAAAADFSLKALNFGLIILQWTPDNPYENEGVICFDNNWKSRDQRAREEKTYNNGRFSKIIRKPSGVSEMWYCCMTQEATRAKGYALDG